MNIAIFTSKNHLYANFLLGRLLLSGVFDSHKVLILEQSCIVPGLGSIAGLIRYFRTAGPYYVYSQAVKQWLYTILSLFTVLSGRRKSPLYPYHLLFRKNVHRRTFDRVKEPRQQEFLRAFKPDLILSLLSKEVLPECIVNLPVYGSVNLHPAPLPAYRGVSPTFWCLNDGANHSGITLHWMESKIDIGEIISQKLVPLQGIVTEHDLYMRCMKEGAVLVADFLRGPFPRQRKEHAVSEEGCVASYRSLPTRKAVINFKKRGYHFFKIIELLRMANG